jgi:6,7-dimethyl-8-ribityllumazine synthase
MKFAVVTSRFNEEITDRLTAGAVRSLTSHGVRTAAIDRVKVSGAFELPGQAMRLARSRKYRAIVAVGCILEGDTKHDDYLSQSTMTGLMMVSVLTGVPVTCGVITAKNWKQAEARSLPKGVNRGWEAAEAAWELSR